jgi:polygalacturonase
MKILRILIPFGSIVLLCISCSPPGTSYNILDYGARGDGKTMNTRAINKAITKCNSKGGGTVLIPPGIFVTGTVVLRSNVNLHLEPGSVLSGSKDTSDYLKMNSTLFNEGYNRFGMLCALEAANISITGSGEINGNGTFFMNGLDKPHMGGGDFDRRFIRQGEEFMKPDTIFEDGPVSYPYRPGLMITIERCENVHITDVRFTDSPEWTIRIGDCDNVDIRGISILNNQLIPNNDGIHVTTSRNVRISDCNILTGDDAIIVSGFGTSPLPGDLISKEKLPLSIGNKTGIAENVTVTNCVLSSRSACIRVGYGTHPIRNLIFSNLVMHDSNRGIGVFARDDSKIENILFSDIIINNRLHSGHWWGKGEPIHISAIRDTKNGTAGTIDNIRFSNITATSETGILIYGTEKSIIKNIYMNNIQLTIKKGRYTGSYGGNFDLRPAWPLSEALFSHDISGLYACWVNNLEVSQFDLNWGPGLPSFFTYGVEIDHFHDVLMKDLRVDPSPGSKGISAILLSNGVKAVMINCTASSENILVTRNNLKQ